MFHCLTVAPKQQKQKGNKKQSAILRGALICFRISICYGTFLTSHANRRQFLGTAVTTIICSFVVPFS